MRAPEGRVVPVAGRRCEPRTLGAGGGGTAPGSNTLIKREQEPTVVRGHRHRRSLLYRICTFSEVVMDRG
jgi:hypothetical protein